MAKPHDASYKLLFSSPEMVRDLILGFVPDKWLRKLDYSTLERVSGSYITDDLRERADDIVWRVRAGGQWVYLYLLIEFQSGVDPWMSVRILTYVGLLYQDLIRRGEILPGQRLPPVLPIVLYSGEKPWRAATNIADLIPKLPGQLSRYLPSLEYILIDENNYAPEHLAQLSNLVAAMMRIERPESAQDLIGLVDLIAKMLQDKPELRRTFAIWINSVIARRGDNALVLPQVQDLQEMKMRLAERMDLWAEQYKQEGWQKGRQEGWQKGRQEGRMVGLQEGRQEGRQEGEALVLQRLLAKRFGPLPIDVTRKIAAAGADDLETWFDRLLDAPTLETVFRP